LLISVAGGLFFTRAATGRTSSMETAAAHAFPDERFAGIYRRRRPEKTVLYRVIQENLETYLATAREACLDDDPVPAYVEKTFRDYLRCGVLACGACRIFCDTCRHEYLTAFSCKRRAVCVSCQARHGAQIAAHLVDHVIPRVPIRHWTFSFPKRVRYFVKNCREVASGVLRVCLRAVETTLRQRSPGAPKEARFGAVSFAGLAGSSLNEHYHFHVLVTEGVFAADVDGAAGAAEFFEAMELTEGDIVAVEQKVRRRVLRYLGRHGYLDSDTVKDMLGWDHAGGFSLDAARRLEEGERYALEDLARYCAKPTLSLERLEQLDAEVLIYCPPKPAPDGRTALKLTPLELIARLAALVPLPQANLVRYWGVLAPRASLRQAVVASAGPSAALQMQLEEAAKTMELESEADPDHPAEQAAAAAGDSDHSRPGAAPATAETSALGKPNDEQKPRHRYVWAMLMARVFDCLPLRCPVCGNAMRVLAFITEPYELRRLLRHVGEPAEPPSISPARSPPPADFEMDQTIGLADDAVAA
jgi:hypothetical protein